MTNRDILDNSVTAGHRPARPGVGTWVTFLIALLFTGICGAVWVNNEDMAAWLLSEGVVKESGTRTLPGSIRSWAMWSGIAGLTAVPLVLLWGVFGITPWAPAQALVTQSWRAVRPGLSSLRAFAEAFVLLVGRLSAWLLRPVALAFAATAQAIGVALGYTWLVVSIPVVCLWRGLLLGLGYLRVSVSAVLGYLGHVLAVALHYTWLAIFTPVSASWRGLVLGLGYLRMGVSAPLGYLGRVLAVALRYTWLAISIPVSASWMGLVLGLGYLRVGVSALLGYLGRVLEGALRYVWRAVSIPVAASWRGLVLELGYLRMGISAVLGYLGRVLAVALHYTWLVVFTPVAASWIGLVLGLGYLRMLIFGALRHLLAGISAMALPVGLAIALAGSGVLKAFGYLGIGVITVLSLLGLAAYAIAWAAVLALRPLAIGVWTIAQAAGSALPYLYRPVLLVLRLLGLGFSTIALLLAAACSGLLRRVALAPREAYRSAAFAGRTIWTGFGTLPDVGKTAVWIAQHRKGVYAMSDFSLTRQRVLSLIATLWLFAILVVSHVWHRRDRAGGVSSWRPEC